MAIAHFSSQKNFKISKKPSHPEASHKCPQKHIQNQITWTMIYKEHFQVTCPAPHSPPEDGTLPWKDKKWFHKCSLFSFFLLHFLALICSKISISWFLAVWVLEKMTCAAFVDFVKILEGFSKSLPQQQGQEFEGSGLKDCRWGRDLSS